MKITCIALDLDHTTLDDHGRLSGRNRRAVLGALAAGIHVVVASGRPLRSLPREILEIPGIRYAITSNGVAVHDLKEGICLRKVSMDARLTDRVVAMTREDVVYEAYIDGTAYAEEAYVRDPVRFGAKETAVSYIQSTRIPVAGMEAFLARHREELDCMDLVVADREIKKKLWESLETIPGIYVTSSVPQLLEVSGKEAGKEAGLRFLLNHLGLLPEHLAAFGDGDNDSDMLSYAGLGVAVANGTEGCRQAADLITSSSQEDGVAEVIEKLLEENGTEEEPANRRM